jgi:cytochrome c biogenesis protein CcmG, thiol:disulfide interchange protein DsbE
MKLLALLPVAIFGLLAGLFWTGMGKDDTKGLPSAYLGQPAPALTVEPLGPDFAPLTAEMLAADGVKVVNFWASWCAPCRAEHPNLVALAQLGIPVYGVNYKDKPENAVGFLNELGNPFKALAADPSGRTGLDWGLYGVPETFIIDRKGRVVFRFPGPVTNEILQTKILPELAKAGNG